MPQASVRHDDVAVLLTGSEAFPAFERLFLEARERLSLGFRIFDPRTRLNSPEAQQIGQDWFDLIVHTLARGVRLDITLSDFDPIVRPDYHQRAHRCLRLLIAAGEASGKAHLLSARTALHPSRIGRIASIALWPKSHGYLVDTVEWLNGKPGPERARALRELPGLMPFLAVAESGEVRLRRGVLPRLVPVTHHQKIAVADGARLYVGGLDLNDRRFDTPNHDRPADETWHDTQLLVDGPAAAAAEAHLRTFLDTVRDGTPPPPPGGLLRTLARRRSGGAPFLSPMPVLTEIGTAHEVWAMASRRLIYLESQFFRDRRFARTLARAARMTPELGLVLILPAAPDDVAFGNNGGSDARYGEFLQAKCVDILRRAFGDRLFIGSPAQPRAATGQGRAVTYGAPIIYLHAKVSIFDDRAALVSSANLNGRSFRWDTEAGVLLDRPEHVAALARRCGSHWLGRPVPEDFADPGRAVEAWRAQARANARRAPEDREGYILPYSAAPARRFGRNLPGIPEEMV